MWAKAPSRIGLVEGEPRELGPGIVVPAEKRQSFRRVFARDGEDRAGRNHTDRQGVEVHGLRVEFARLGESAHLVEEMRDLPLNLLDESVDVACLPLVKSGQLRACFAQLTTDLASDLEVGSA